MLIQLVFRRRRVLGLPTPNAWISGERVGEGCGGYEGREWEAGCGEEMFHKPSVDLFGTWRMAAGDANRALPKFGRWLRLRFFIASGAGEGLFKRASLPRLRGGGVMRQ